MSVSRMKAALLLLVATHACVVAVVYGDLPVCDINYCERHPCTNPVAETSCRSPTVYRARYAGICACCPACVTLLNEGSACKTSYKELGDAPSAACRMPLDCFRGVCIKISGRLLPRTD